MLEFCLNSLKIASLNETAFQWFVWYYNCQKNLCLAYRSSLCDCSEQVVFKLPEKNIEAQKILEQTNNWRQTKQTTEEEESQLKNLSY